MIKPAVRENIDRFDVRILLGVGVCLAHVGGEVLGDQHDNGVIVLQLIDHLIPIVNVGSPLCMGEVLRRLQNKVKR